MVIIIPSIIRSSPVRSVNANSGVVHGGNWSTDNHALFLRPRNHQIQRTLCPSRLEFDGIAETRGPDDTIGMQADQMPSTRITDCASVEQTVTFILKCEPAFSAVLFLI